MPTNASLPGQGLPGQILPGFNIPGPLISSTAPVATISTPLAPLPQQLTNFSTLINGQANVVGVMLFIRFNNPIPPTPPLPGGALPGGITPGYPPVPQPRAVLLVEGVDYTRNGGVITMAAPPPVGSVLTAQLFTKGLQLGGATLNRYVSPIALTVTGPYDGVSTTGYGITFGPTISGNVDGVNNLFGWQILFQRVQVWKNGILQTAMQDYNAGSTALVFLPGAIPQPGDILTLLGYNNC